MDEQDCEFKPARSSFPLETHSDSPS